MILRVIRGQVRAGRETDFVEACRRTVLDRARSPGLVSFFPGYRRVGGTERFILAAMWESADHAQASAGSPDSPTARTVLADVADVQDVEVYDGIEPAFHGLIDAPGGVVRVGSALVKPDRKQDLLAWLAGNSRSAQPQRLALGWAMGERVVDERLQMIAISAWPSKLVIEALSEPGSTSDPLFADARAFVDDFAVEQYQAIGLDLPSELSDLGARRMLAFRFESREAADAAAGALARTIPSAVEVPASVAPLGAPGTATEVRSWILVVRVSLADYPRAERLIADHEGEIILATREADTQDASALTGDGPALSVSPAH